MLVDKRVDEIIRSWVADRVLQGGVSAVMFVFVFCFVLVILNVTTLIYWVGFINYQQKGLSVWTRVYKSLYSGLQNFAVRFSLWMKENLRENNKQDSLFSWISFFVFFYQHEFWNSFYVPQNLNLEVLCIGSL